MDYACIPTRAYSTFILNCLIDTQGLKELLTNRLNIKINVSDRFIKVFFIGTFENCMYKITSLVQMSVHVNFVKIPQLSSHYLGKSKIKLRKYKINFGKSKIISESDKIN